MLVSTKVVKNDDHRKIDIKIGRKRSIYGSFVRQNYDEK